MQDDSKIDYGYYSRTGGAEIATAQKSCTNGPAYMGHAYKAITSDVLVRYQCLSGQNDAVFFLTSSAEHGQNVAQTAAAQAKEPIEICNQYATGFQVLNQRILI